MSEAEKDQKIIEELCAMKEKRDTAGPGDDKPTVDDILGKMDELSMEGLRQLAWDGLESR